MIKKGFWTTLASMAFALQSLLTNKLFSLYFGPQGVALLAHYQNLIAIFTTVPNDGINRGVVRFLADPALEQKKWSNYFTAAFLLNLLAFGGGLIVMAVFFQNFYYDFPPDLFTISNLFLISLALLLHVATIFLINLILSSSLVVAYSIISIISNILAAVVVYYGLQKGITTALVFLSFAPCLVLPGLAIYYYKKHLLRFKNLSLETNLESVKQIGSFIATAVSGVILAKTIDFFVRAHIIQQYDYYQTGLWQAIVKMSDGYSTIFNAAFGMLFFVKISSLINDHQKLTIFVRKSLLFVFVLSLTGLSFIYLLRNELLVLFYNSEFKAAAVYLDFQLLGDLFKFPSWIFGFLLLSQLKMKQYIFAQVASGVIYCLLLTALVPKFGIEGLPMAHFIRFVLYFLLMTWLCKKWLLSNQITEKGSLNDSSPTSTV